MPFAHLRSPSLTCVPWGLSQDMFNEKVKPMKLFVKRVFISDNFEEELLPRYVPYITPYGTPYITPYSTPITPYIHTLPSSHLTSHPTHHTLHLAYFGGGPSLCVFGDEQTFGSTI